MSSFREVTLQLKDLFLLEVGPGLAFCVDVKNSEEVCSEQKRLGSSWHRRGLPPYSCYVTFEV